MNAAPQTKRGVQTFRSQFGKASAPCRTNSSLIAGRGSCGSFGANLCDANTYLRARLWHNLVEQRGAYHHCRQVACAFEACQQLHLNVLNVGYRIARRVAAVRRASCAHHQHDCMQALGDQELACRVRRGQLQRSA